MKAITPEQASKLNPCDYKSEIGKSISARSEIKQGRRDGISPAIITGPWLNQASHISFIVGHHAYLQVMRINPALSRVLTAFQQQLQRRPELDFKCSCAGFRGQFGRCCKDRPSISCSLLNCCHCPLAPPQMTTNVNALMRYDDRLPVKKQAIQNWMSHSVASQAQGCTSLTACFLV